MSATRCRVCMGPLKVIPIGAAGARAVSVRLTVRGDAGQRIGEFALCPRCTVAAMSRELGGNVGAVLFAELQALLR